ncbi:uncharacterized protein LOC119080850 [Bradysia coprophila]|uniref:uncharacterized protein LOC119080850 n=1 Tax=Bradysia coprophila TaxID=38358 RepID=UPI00187D8F58|nr:uncharacterized protein LOC119080850 [Bradysia coprophila]
MDYKDLWRKESANKNALYCDLLENVEKNYPEVKKFNIVGLSKVVFEEKNNETADRHRQEGNTHCYNMNYELAIKYYNESLCLAETGTKCLGMAYGNRSSCFLRMKKYGNCIVDVDLALNEPICPRLVKRALENRKIECLKIMSTEEPTKLHEVQLSYKPHDNFPFIANVLEIQKNAEFGRHVIAKCNIPAGKMIMIEDDFIPYTKATNYISKKHFPMKCNTCNRNATNPIPCSSCTVVMFCNMQCKNENEIHKIDCGAIYYRYDNTNSKYIIQSVLHAINLFPTIFALRKFVEDAVKADKMEIPASVLDEESKYRMFLKLWRPPMMKDFIPSTYNYFHTIMCISVIRMKFNTEVKRRFLMHLVGHHAVIMLFNSWQGQLSLFTSLLSHSCAPNIQEVYFDSRTALITIRPIKRGDQIYSAYKTETSMAAQRLNRKEEIERKFGFRCKCLKCEGKMVEMRSIEEDPIYKRISETHLLGCNRVMLEDYISTCIGLLNKYKRLPLWSRQLDNVSTRVGFCLALLYYTMTEVK